MHLWTCSQRLAFSHRGPVLTCIQGTSADLMEQVARLYLAQGSTVTDVTDVTYGTGTFWRRGLGHRFRLLTSDIYPTTGGLRADCRSLPYRSGAIDVVVFDPPFMHGGRTIKASINRYYLNDNGSGKTIMDLYRRSIEEAYRVLKSGGLALVKVGDEIESGQLQLRHMSVRDVLVDAGFGIVTYFVLMRQGTPLMRESYQLHPRTNHSFLWVARKAGQS